MSRLREFFAVVLLLFNSSRVNGENNPLDFSTSTCELTEPYYGHKFDFNGLRSDFEHLATSDNNDSFTFNFCGNITRTCDGQSNVAACLTRGNREYVLGRQQELRYKNGKMAFKYSNGSACPNSTDEFQLHVFIGCDYTLDKIQAKVTPYADHSCSFYIKYETPLACLPIPDAVQTNTCSVRDTQTGHTFDLMPLSDYNYRTTDGQGSAFIINVCKPVLYGENAACPPGSSVCFFSTKATDYKKKFFNYGTVQPNPVIENNKLVMYQTSTTQCNATSNYTSNIYFYCDKNVKNAHPEFIGKHGCLYEFNFVTPLACNDLAPCTVVTHGNEILDLSALMNHDPFTLSLSNENYTFAVCKNAGLPCLEKSGACTRVNGQTTRLGLSNTNLLLNGLGSPYLLYDGGAPCQKSDGSKTQWSTKIEFVCANNTTIDKGSTTTTQSADAALQPKIIENSNCQLLIQYQTHYACQEQITCKAKVNVDHSEDGTNEEMVDLTPLISTTENYEAKVNLSSPNEAQNIPPSMKFFLNVCRPLVPKYQLGCAGGSAACMANVGESGSPEEEQSLGFPLASLVPLNRTTVKLRYFKGNPCPSDKSTDLSTSILFYCDMHVGRGTPVLRSITDCQYEFHWATSVICPPHTCDFDSNTCEIQQKDIGLSYNFKNAPFAEDGKVKIKLNQTDFSLNICGKHRKAITDYSQDLVNIYFTEKGPCGLDGIINVQMRLICSNKTEREIFFGDDFQCNLLYVQRTPDICAFLGLVVPPNIGTTTTSPMPTADSQHTDNNEHPAERTGSIGTILAAILSLTFFVACVGVLAFSPERRQSLRRLFRRSTSAVRYSTVQSNEEANLLMEQNGEFTESDDDMLL